MKESVELFGQDSPATVLKPDLSSGIDPDDYFSSIPYGNMKEEDKKKIDVKLTCKKKN